MPEAVGFYTDTTVCIGCKACQVACHQWNDLPAWEDRPDGSTVIRQQVLVERDSQKAIVIGKGGRRLKEIGAAAREQIAQHLARPVHLFLHVKVNPRWDEDRGLYREIGLEWAD